jgi:RNA polymerase sigma-70 factor, ECF subfamily
MQTSRMDINEAQRITLLAQRDERAFEQVFKQHFKELHAYACTITRQEEAAEGIVQHVFLNLWEKAGNLNIQPPIAAYLYKSVYNHSLNYLKHQKVRHAYEQFAARHYTPHTDHTARKALLTDLEKKLRLALDKLPEQCRTIFQLSRFEELKYQEIADKLGISVKTVEAQMSKALRILRTELADYLPIFILTILY